MMSKCIISDFSSRVCERGTKGCTTYHEIDDMKQRLADFEQAARKVVELAVPQGNGYFVWAGDLELLRQIVKGGD